MTTDETLNELLVRLFKDIMEIEARCLVNEEFKDISYNDFHRIKGAEKHDGGGKADGCHDRYADEGDGWPD